MLGCAGQRRMSSMGYLGMISVPIPRLRTESADADEVSLLLFPFTILLCALRLVWSNPEAWLLIKQAC